MGKNYSKFNKIDFSIDKYFLQWRLNPDEETEKFWNKFLEENPEKKVEVNEAIRIIDSVKINGYKFTSEEIRAGLNKIKSRKEKRKRRQLIYAVSSAAAIVLAILTVFTPVFKISHKDLAEVKVQAIEKPNDIQLIISNNEILSFDNDADIAYSNKGEITINTSEKKQVVQQKEEQIQFNKLIVPYGKRSSLMLADGSKITVNSGSVLEFPPAFKGDKREIKIQGEAYLEVVKNKDKPFIVTTSQMSVNVLGTTFNISAYDDDESQNVVLVEGSVNIEANNGNSVLLKPNELSALKNGILNTQTVDVYNYISWKDGIFQFSGEPLKNVLLKLSRYYNIPVESTNDSKNLLLSGKLVLFDDINTVLENIAVIVPININKSENKITININKE